VYALNARTELLYGTAAAECTSVGVLDRQSASGHTVLAQNWDWHPDHRPYALVLATRDERGFAVVTLTEAGMLAKAGLNGAGLGACVNMLGTERDGGPAGLPYHVLVRAVLEADCLALALRAVCPAPRSASINVMLGQSGPGWGGGEIVDLELVPGDLGILHPVDGLLAHANHIETDLPLRDTLKDRGGSSYFRAARAARLLRRVATGRRVATEDLVALLSDHGGYPHAICRHLDPRDCDDERSETICSVLLDLDERRISVAAGQPCATPYQDLWLDRLFDTAAGSPAGQDGRPAGAAGAAERPPERLDQRRA
jgi:isopenicillin-N N-acyltransferase-like protein